MLLPSFGSFQRRPGCSRLLLAAPACSWRLPGCSLAAPGYSLAAAQLVLDRFWAFLRAFPLLLAAPSGSPGCSLPPPGRSRVLRAARGCSQWLPWHHLGRPRLLLDCASSGIERGARCLDATAEGPAAKCEPGCSQLLCPRLRRLRQLWHRARSEMPRRDSGGPNDEV